MSFPTDRGGRGTDPEIVDDVREQLAAGSFRFTGKNPADSVNAPARARVLPTAMDPERLADLRKGLGDNRASERPVPHDLVCDLLADRDRLAAEVNSGFVKHERWRLEMEAEVKRLQAVAVGKDGGHRDDSTPTIHQTPETWGEYFDLLKVARRANRAAATVFNLAGDRLGACSDRVTELEAWATAADKIFPYTGSHDLSVRVVVGKDGES